jgi:hypothetical protein
MRIESPDFEQNAILIINNAVRLNVDVRKKWNQIKG